MAETDEEDEGDEEDEAKGLSEGWSCAAPRVQWPSLLIWPIFQHPSHVSLQAVKLHMLQQRQAILPLLHWLRRQVPIVKCDTLLEI